ncbi:hypothetical protein F2Q70_00036344 [Brassica cretica]|uniref:Uncharacterized protein n=1 Tax=Brassica cretica TaxID=69181 RepID=A0A8S9JYX4_BRACR|nr:hypothetical protein F2Q70_00036344 [Brassica cretica]
MSSPSENLVRRLLRLSASQFSVLTFTGGSSKTGFRARPRFTFGLRLCDDK